MDLQRFEVLEGKISQAIKLINALKDENRDLKARVQTLENTHHEKDEELARLRTELGHIKSNADESRQLREREEKIRSKVEDMLAKLEELQLQF